ncbi:MAG: hypothetical protein E7310_08115 [Clostridiales bacterium]|nr:hypothetical protein [Clostridiales bacterium]
MENVKIISDSGIEVNVNGIFYIYNSKYFLIYTTGEIDENEYVKLYVAQICKEVQNTQNGPIDTGYMIGLEIANPEEWKKVQESITKIVESKKSGLQSSDIQYLPMDMLVNLKIVSKNKFKLMKHIIENDFKLILTTNIVGNSGENVKSENNNNLTNQSNTENLGEVIIDYRARFFEEQEKNQILEEQIKNLNEKLENIKNIIG